MNEEIIYNQGNIVVSDRQITTYKHKTIPISQVREVYCCQCSLTQSLKTLNSIIIGFGIGFLLIDLVLFSHGILAGICMLAWYMSYRQYYADTVIIGVRTDRENIPVGYFTYGSQNNADAIQKQNALKEAINLAVERYSSNNPVADNDISVAPTYAEATTKRQAVGSSSSQKAHLKPIDDKPFYAQAMAECSDRISERDSSLWAKAFSLSAGDDKRTQAKYIELRVLDLLEQEQLRIKYEQKRTEEERKRVEKQQNLIEEQHIQKDWEALTPAQLEFVSRFPIGKYYSVLFKHYGHRVTRMSVESDASYATRLQRFAKEYEKETGLKIG